MQERDFRRRAACAGAATLVAVAGFATVSGHHAVRAAMTPLVIGVDYVDPANQDPQNGRVFEYNDFFSRSFSVHRGDTVTFRLAPYASHVIAVLAPGSAAGVRYLGADTGDLPAASGGPRIVIENGQWPISHGQVGVGSFQPFCGVAAMGQPTCSFGGGADVESSGGLFGADQNGLPAPLDWSITINAPEGEYLVVDPTHPSMRAALEVVSGDDQTTTQAQVDRATTRQFSDDRAAALATEKRDNVVRYRGGKPGARVYQMLMGASAADGHVSLTEVLPRSPLALVAGDRVEWTWADTQEVHNVYFNDDGSVQLFGADCGTSYANVPPGCVEPGSPQPELIADPGNTPAGTVLTSLTAPADSGVLAGSAHRVHGAVTRWGVATGAPTPAGTYSYHCAIHPWMSSSFTVAAAA